MTNETQTTTAPEHEMRTNALGHLVPVHLIKPIDLLRDEVVMELIAMGHQQQELMLACKQAMQKRIVDFLDLSASEYDVTWGGAKGNVTLLSFDGKYKIERAIGEHRVFNEHIQAAKAKIDACIERWSPGSSAEIRALVDHAFRVGKQGRIDVNQVLSLRQLAIDDPEWMEAMQACADAITAVSKTEYIRLYERLPSGKYTAISLDWAKL